MKKRISAEEFIKRCDKAGQMFIGSMSEDNVYIKAFIRQLEHRGFKIEFVDNDVQPNYSPIMWIKPKLRHGRLSMSANELEILMSLRPDEFHYGSGDGFFRLWWD